MLKLPHKNVLAYSKKHTSEWCLDMQPDLQLSFVMVHR